MKFVAIALIGAALADDNKKAGDPCATSPDCGDDTMCCGVGTKGVVCDNETCANPTTNAAPNVSVCNTRDTATDFKTQTPNFDGKTIIWSTYKGTDFTCGAKQLVASAIALLATASMM